MNSFLYLDTFKSWDFISYKDSHRDLSKCSNTITWVHDYNDLSASCPMGDELRVIET